VLDPDPHQLLSSHTAVGGFLGKALRSWWIFLEKHFAGGGFLLGGIAV